MHKKSLIFLSLLSAYLLMLAHSIIPHHHHESLLEAAEHHQQEQGDHHHHDRNSEGHDHTPHFVHSSDFGNGVFAPSLNLTDSTEFSVDVLYTCILDISFPLEKFSSDIPWYFDIPPPNLICTSSPNSLRGSPISIS